MDADGRKLRAVVAEKVGDLDRLLSPEVWRSMAPVLRGQRLREIRDALEDAVRVTLP